MNKRNKNNNRATKNENRNGSSLGTESTAA